MKRNTPIQKKTLGSYPVFHVVISTTFALFVVGLLGFFVLHARQFSSAIRESMKVHIYLEKHIQESDIVRIGQFLRSQPFLFKKAGRGAMRFISKEEAAKRFIKETGENFTEVLGENPLHNAYEISISAEYQSPEALQKIKNTLEEIDGIFEASYVENIVSELNKNINKLQALLGIFGLILLIVVSVLINNSIKLALYSQRFLIRSMQLVGATGTFIRKPFLTRALFMGFMSGIFANTLLVLVLYYANLRVDALVSLQQPSKVAMIIGSTVGIGMGLCYLSTRISINKYLRMSLDDLY